MTKYEDALLKSNITLIAGVDEAGRGPLAGPVVAAAVILAPHTVFKYVNDSKKLSPAKLQLALSEIKEKAISIGVSFVYSHEIDQINIYNATKEAMESAINALSIQPQYILVDAVPLTTKIPNQSIIKGDQKSITIAAASVIAKTSRDAYMIEMSKVFPNYGFERHKGYGTKFHLEMIAQYGPCTIHRLSFKPMNKNEKNRKLK